MTTIPISHAVLRTCAATARGRILRRLKSSPSVGLDDIYGSLTDVYGLPAAAVRTAIWDLCATGEVRIVSGDTLTLGVVNLAE